MKCSFLLILCTVFFTHNVYFEFIQHFKLKYTRVYLAQKLCFVKVTSLIVGVFTKVQTACLRLTIHNLCENTLAGTLSFVSVVIYKFKLIYCNIYSPFW